MANLPNRLNGCIAGGFCIAVHSIFATAAGEENDTRSNAAEVSSRNRERPGRAELSSGDLNPLSNATVASRPNGEQPKTRADEESNACSADYIRFDISPGPQRAMWFHSGLSMIPGTEHRNHPRLAPGEARAIVFKLVAQQRKRPTSSRRNVIRTQEPAPNRLTKVPNDPCTAANSRVQLQPVWDAVPWRDRLSRPRRRLQPEQPVRKEQPRFR
jgi:hypothetical protein